MKEDEGQAFVSQTGIFIETVRQPAASMINGAAKPQKSPPDYRI